MAITYSYQNVEITYINKYGLLMTRVSYDDSGEHSYGYEYE